jgi:hypothetical protein
MKMWYVRRRAGLDTKTVVIIASWPGYWGSQYNYQPRERGWVELWPSQINAMGIQSLMDNVLPRASGVTAWW